MYIVCQNENRLFHSIINSMSMKIVKQTGFWALTAAMLTGGISGEVLAQKARKNSKPTTTVEASTPKLADPVKGATVEGITEYTLQNGMKVLLFPDPSQQTITVNITYLVGSRHEGYGETGMAHLLEHLVFKGTPKHPNIPQELAERGARPNGTTWLDRTNYYETFNATEDNLRWALDLESDRMVNSFIKKEDLETEYSVVRNEFEMGENDPGSILRERIIASGYLWHNYGNSTIGSREDIERVPIDNLQAFYKKYYQPDNAILIVAGKIDPVKTLQMVNEYFGPIPRPSRKLTPTYTVEPTQDGERSVVLRRVGDVQYVGAMYHISPGTHPDYAPMDILINIITDEPSGILYKNLVETKKAASQYGFSFSLKEPGLAYFAAEVLKDKDLEDAKNAFLKTLDDVQTMKITKEDVDRAKNKLSKRFELILRNTDVLGRGLSEYIAQGDWRTFFLYRDAVEKVTADDVMRVAKYYFKPSNRTYGTFIPESNPERVKVPEAPNVEELVKNYKGRAAIAQGEAFDPSPANIDARTQQFNLPNGMEVAFLPKTTRGNVVSANLSLRLGDAQSLKGKSMVASLTGDMLMYGSKQFSRQALKDTLDKLKAQVNIFGGGNSAGAVITTTRDNLPTVMKILTEVLQNPVFDASEFEKLKAEQKAQIEAQLSDPMALASNTFGRIMNPAEKDDIRYSPTFPEMLEGMEKVTVEDMKKFHAEFYGASSASLSVVGDFDTEAIKSILTSGLGSWKSKTQFRRIPSNFEDRPAQVEAIKTPDKPNAMFLAGLNMPLQDTDPDYPALLVGNYVLGGGFLNSRLAVRIRQKEGISYGVGSQLTASSLDKKGMFITYAIYAPENAARLEQAFQEEINKARNEGFTEAEIKAAIDGLIQANSVARAKDNELAGKLTNYLYLDRNLQFDAKMEEALRKLTPEQINAAFRKYIEPSKISIIKAGDFDKPAPVKAAEPGAKTSTGGQN